MGDLDRSYERKGAIIQIKSWCFLPFLLTSKQLLQSEKHPSVWYLRFVFGSIHWICFISNLNSFLIQFFKYLCHIKHLFICGVNKVFQLLPFSCFSNFWHFNCQCQVLKYNSLHLKRLVRICFEQLGIFAVCMSACRYALTYTSLGRSWHSIV